MTNNNQIQIKLHDQIIIIPKEMNSIAKIYHHDGFDHLNSLPNDYLKADFLFGLHQTLIERKTEIIDLYADFCKSKKQSEVIYKNALKTVHKLFLAAMQYSD